MHRFLNLQTLAGFLELIPDAALTVNRKSQVVGANAEAAPLFGYTQSELVGKSISSLVPKGLQDIHTHHVKHFWEEPHDRRMGENLNIICRRKDDSEFYGDIMLSPIMIENSAYVLCLIRDITKNKEMELHLRKSEETYRLLVENSAEVKYRVMIGGNALQGKVEFVSEPSKNLTGHDPKEFIDNPKLWHELIHPADHHLLSESTMNILTTKRMGIREYRLFDKSVGNYRWIEDYVVPLLDLHGEVVGYQGTARDITVKKKHQQHLESLVHLNHSLRNLYSREQIMSESASIGTRIFEADAVAFVMIDEIRDEMVFEETTGAVATAKGFRIPNAESFSWKVAQDMKTYTSENLHLDANIPPYPWLKQIQAIACAPMVTQDKAIGVFWVGRQRSFERHEIDLLETISALVANCIFHITLLETQRQQTMALFKSYERTIEAWAMALELRDHETHGHTLRVTEMTVKLARSLGISEEEVVNIRRGALLHDIGKIAVSDTILLKAAALTNDERSEIEKHPAYALQMLSTIEFLKSAAEIPYYHHEKWDGTGYPHGLRGEEIPLSARIFAIVDVWDALNSDRPYRKAWPKDEALRYIHEQNGKHFDPRIVEHFMKIITDPDNQ
jgi:PAS domain S-box-containing protein/putative nucleotidyltransferase with HDIG domain